MHTKWTSIRITHTHQHQNRIKSYKNAFVSANNRVQIE